MPEPTNQNLSDLSETYLAPIYWKAAESQCPDAMIKDEKAVALVTQNSIDFSRVRQIKMNELLQAMRIIFTREIDRYAREFIILHPDAVVVHIGCGLDSRFERVAEHDEQVEWYDLDLPEVIELRRRFIGDEHAGYHLLGCSVLEEAWQEAVKVHSQRPFLFLAETVFVYFTEAQVKSLVSGCATISRAQSCLLMAGDLSKSGRVIAISPNLYMRDLCTGASGVDRSSKAGATASACSMNGASSISLSPG